MIGPLVQSMSHSDGAYYGSRKITSEEYLSIVHYFGLRCSQLKCSEGKGDGRLEVGK